MWSAAARRSLELAVGVGRRRFSAAASTAAPAAGTLYMCGTGESHKLGLGETKDRENPTLVEALKDTPIVHVACGKYHSAAVSSDGDVYVWGLESSGQLGLGSARTKAHTPTKVEALSGKGVTQLSCGMYHTLALTAAGEVYSCGFGGSLLNGAGGLGHGNRTQLEAFAKLASFGPDGTEGVAAATVSAGGYHSVVLDREGGVWTFGRGEWGRLGHGDASDCLAPTRVLAPARLEGEESPFGPSLVAQAGEGHTGVLGVDGMAYTWGRNEHWQLGYEVVGLLNSGQSFDAQQEPQAVEIAIEIGSQEEGKPTPKATRVACGESGTAALLEDGRVFVWGMQRFFQPTLVPGADQLGSEIVDLQVGASHLALRTASGHLYTYGVGPSLALAKLHRKQWELAEVNAHSLDGAKVVGMACGPYSTALIVG
jgi:alpha-tubulin suppressor-like RCC1 family protein